MIFFCDCRIGKELEVVVENDAEMKAWACCKVVGPMRNIENNVQHAIQYCGSFPIRCSARRCKSYIPFLSSRRCKQSYAACHFLFMDDSPLKR